MTRRRRANYVEGDWIAIPLSTERFGVGRIARSRPPVFVCYAFVHTYAKPPELADLAELKPEDAVIVAMVGDLGLITGEWLVVGHDPHEWTTNRSRWPIPRFGFQDPLLGISWAREYDPNDPTKPPVRQFRISAEERERLPADGLYGFRAFVQKLEHLLHHSR